MDGSFSVLIFKENTNELIGVVTGDALTFQ
jgi:hypothetical protein